MFYFQFQGFGLWALCDFPLASQFISDITFKYQFFRLSRLKLNRYLPFITVF